MSLDSDSRHVVFADSKNQVQVFDTRRLDIPLVHAASKLGYKVRRICLLPGEERYALSCAGGRVSIEQFSQQEHTSLFTFRCHRKMIENRAYMYPVNALSVHPRFKTLLTGGTDGTCDIWDLTSRKKISRISAPVIPPQVQQEELYRLKLTSQQTNLLSQISPSPSQGCLTPAVADAEFSRDGSLLAIAFSYSWEMGAIPGAIPSKEQTKNQIKTDDSDIIEAQEVKDCQIWTLPSSSIMINVRSISDTLVRPKNRTGGE